MADGAAARDAHVPRPGHLTGILVLDGRSAAGHVAAGVRIARRALAPRNDAVVASGNAALAGGIVARVDVAHGPALSAETIPLRELYEAPARLAHALPVHAL